MTLEQLPSSVEWRIGGGVGVELQPHDGGTYRPVIKVDRAGSEIFGAQLDTLRAVLTSADELAELLAGPSPAPAPDGAWCADCGHAVGRHDETGCNVTGERGLVRVCGCKLTRADLTAA